MSNQFTYSILQYKHSLALGEALNIGVLFSFPEENKIHFVPGNPQRVKCVYPNFDATIFSRITKNIKSKISESSQYKYYSNILGLIDHSFKEYINKEILPEDSTALQFTEPFTAINDTGNSKTAIEEFSKILLPEPEDKSKINQSLSFELTTIWVEDKKSGNYSAFFAQFPEAIAQGRNEDEAEMNLYDIFAVMLHDKKNEVMKRVEGERYKSKQINLAVA